MSNFDTDNELRAAVFARIQPSADSPDEDDRDQEAGQVIYEYGGNDAEHSDSGGEMNENASGRKP